MEEINRENARKIEIDESRTLPIEDVVEYLIDCRDKGESVCIDFNGRILYSADVTLEGAYLQIAGVTPQEFYNIQAEKMAANTAEQYLVLERKYKALVRGHIEEQKKEAKQVWGHGETIAEAVGYLIDCRKNGESVCIDFNGRMLYSADVTLNGAYLQITGLTKEEADNRKAECAVAKTDEQVRAVIEKYEALKQRHIDEKNIIRKHEEKR